MHAVPIRIIFDAAPRPSSAWGFPNLNSGDLFGARLCGPSYGWALSNLPKVFETEAQRMQSIAAIRRKLLRVRVLLAAQGTVSTTSDKDSLHMW